MIFYWGFHYFLHFSGNVLDSTNLQIASTSPSPVDQQVTLSQGGKRKVTATRKGQTRRTIVPDEEDGQEFCEEDAQGQTRVQKASDGPEFCMEDAEGQIRVQNATDGPEFHMKDAEGQTRVQDEPDGSEFHIKDMDDHSSIQDNAKGPGICRTGARTARQARRRKPL